MATEETRCFAEEKTDLFIREFEKETDRAAGIVGASILDSTLESILKSRLVKSPKSKNDLLFDGPNAPLSSFASKIDTAYRLGIISKEMSEALHLVRKIRNTFAHDLVNSDFENSQVRSLVHKLTTLIFRRKKQYDTVRPGFPPGARGDFQIALSRIVWWFWCGAFLKRIKPLPERKFEL